MMHLTMLFIILFLHQTTTLKQGHTFSHCCLSSCSYIKPQLVFSRKERAQGCLSSCSYIKPQLKKHFTFLSNCCLSSCSYIKPQLVNLQRLCRVCCLSSCSYIKPQLFVGHYYAVAVVYHLVPTSNHNLRNRTHFFRGLFIILFLHQTTTIAPTPLSACLLFIILFLHQTTTLGFRRR